MPLRLRSKSLRPNSVSSSLSCLLTAGCSRCRRRAALVTVPASATASSAFSCLRSIARSSAPRYSPRQSTHSKSEFDFSQYSTQEYRHSSKQPPTKGSDVSNEAALKSREAVVERLAGLPTATVSDALDALGLPGSLFGIGRTTGRAITGRAFTVRYEPVDEGGGTVGDFLDEVTSGSVIVIDNAGRLDCTVWGGIMSRVAAARGIAGTVVHGVCRDV